MSYLHLKRLCEESIVLTPSDICSVLDDVSSAPQFHFIVRVDRYFYTLCFNNTCVHTVNRPFRQCRRRDRPMILHRHSPRRKTNYVMQSRKYSKGSSLRLDLDKLQGLYTLSVEFSGFWCNELLAATILLCFLSLIQN